MNNDCWKLALGRVFFIYKFQFIGEIEKWWALQGNAWWWPAVNDDTLRVTMIWSPYNLPKAIIVCETTIVCVALIVRRKAIIVEHQRCSINPDLHIKRSCQFWQLLSFFFRILRFFLDLYLCQGVMLHCGFHSCVWNVGIYLSSIQLLVAENVLQHSDINVAGLIH